MRRAVLALFALPHLSCGILPECESFEDCTPEQICSAESKCVPRPDPCPDEGVGTIVGKVTGPDGETPIIGATISFDGDPATEYTTDADGAYIYADVPAGHHVLYARKGEFTRELGVEVCGGKVESDIEVPIFPPEGSMAVVPGDYDSIQEVLRGMGLMETIHFDMITAEQLKNESFLAGKKYLFLNCTSATLAGEPEVVTSLQNWVAGGGRLYASDWAFEYVEAAFPWAIEYPENPRIGVNGGYQGQVQDFELQQYLGKQAVALEYNLDIWVVANDVATDAQVLVDGAFDIHGAAGTENMYGPLLIQFQEGDGRVTYTTFHNEAQTSHDMDVILAFMIFRL